jgi:low temperature requirement protein LtrA
VIADETVVGATSDARSGQRWHVPMVGRDRFEAHRAATPLELLFDLCFVVAVAQAAGALHHDLVAGEIGHGVLGYLLVFFTIWWPWVNFTWFASAFDTDDVLYRLFTFVQIFGILVVTAGIPGAFDGTDFRTMVLGYVIMRTGLVAQWIRAAIEDPPGRPVAARFAIGISVVQLLWVVRLAMGPPWSYAALIVLGLAELAIPVWAERAGRPTPWNAEHIAERYGLFTIIVLGECVLAVSTAVQAAVAAGDVSRGLVVVALGGLILVFGLWWAYFKQASGIDTRLSLRAAIGWGYGHYFVFASVAALGAGLQVAAESVFGRVAISDTTVALLVAVPVDIYLVSVGLLHAWPSRRPVLAPIAVACLAILAVALAAGSIGVPLAVLAIALIVAGMVGYNLVILDRETASSSLSS